MSIWELVLARLKIENNLPEGLFFDKLLAALDHPNKITRGNTIHRSSYKYCQFPKNEALNVTKIAVVN